jgi:hypothetical protein
MPSRNNLNHFQQSIDNFTVGKLNVARNRITQPVECGGLGMFKIDEFLRAQQSMWVIRTARSQRDNWRTDLFRLSFGNPLISNKFLCSGTSHPILAGLAESFEIVRIAHDIDNENYKKMFILFNPLLYRKANDKRRIDLSFLDTAPDPGQYEKLAKLRFGDCYDEHGLRTRVDLNLSFGLELTVTGYANLGGALNFYKGRRIRNARSDGTDSDFLNSMNFKKPAKKIRALLLKKQKKTLDLEKLTTTTTFFNLIGINYIGTDLFSKTVRLWCGSGFSNRYRTFAFKFFNNILGINVRTSHFGVNATRYCFFCTKERNFNTDESFIHLFFDCPTVRNWHEAFIVEFIRPGGFPIDTDKKKFLFTGILDNAFNYFEASAAITFQFSVWEEKLRKKTPSYHTIKNSFIDRFFGAVKKSSKLRKASIKSNIPLCRYRLAAGPPGAR